MTGRRDEDEGGAIAVMTALLSITLMVTAAFSVDLGMAYTSRVALQTAADAGVLAAAATYAESPGRTCADYQNASGTAAQSAADTYLDKNHSSMSTAASDPLTITCEGGRLRVGTAVRGDTPTFFGRVAGAGSSLTTGATATAAVEVSPGGTGVRPLAICAADVPADAAPGTVWRTYVPGDGQAPSTSCPQPPTSGNWWMLDCPGETTDDGGGQAQMADQIAHGCSEPVTVVSGQAGLSGTGLGIRLRAACPTASTTAPYSCLSGDPGQPDAGHVETAWATLIDEGTTVGLPVFCDAATCGPTVTGTGTNAVFPLQRVVAVTVCGYHFGKQLKKRYGSGLGACSPAATEAVQLMADESEKSYLLLVSRTMFTAGGTADHPCALGDATCDGGLRRVRLVE